MNADSLPFWPANASVTAARVDAVFLGELVLATIILAFVVGMILISIIRYHRGSSAKRGSEAAKSWLFEIGWTAATLLAFVALFAWGARVYLYLYDPGKADLEIYVVGKQWMWKTQHPGGQREINALHVPLGKVVRVVLASEDVIHSFFVPAFRVKHDAVPGTYEVMWFKPTKLGRFPIQCSQYCGLDHSHMVGEVDVMPPADYARWLDDQGVAELLASQGEALFRRYGCSGCHTPGSTVHAPDLNGLYGNLVHLESGETLRADERYIRDCILMPHEHVPAGYAPIMPSFAGQIGEDDLVKLVAYIQSLADGQHRENQP